MNFDEFSERAHVSFSALTLVKTAPRIIARSDDAGRFYTYENEFWHLKQWIKTGLEKIVNVYNHETGSKV